MSKKKVYEDVITLEELQEKEKELSPEEKKALKQAIKDMKAESSK